MSIAVIGAGKWGSALFHAFSENNECVISSRTPREMPNFVSLDEALECEYLVCTIPTQATNLWLKQNYKNKGQKILVASKGIDTANLKFLNEIYEDFVDREKFGLSFRADLCKRDHAKTALRLGGKF